MPRRAFGPPSLSIPPAVIAFMMLAALAFAGCGGMSHPPATPAVAARDLPECRKARLLCGEAQPSPGVREACLRATRECREHQRARNTAPANTSPTSSPETTP